MRLPAILTAAGVLLLAALNLDVGSIHNSDDALYAQIVRETAGGSVWPLRFSGNVYAAKPPLFFWGTAGLRALLPDQDWVYRIPAIKSILLIFIIIYFLLPKVSHYSIFFLTALLLAGSPMFRSHAHRVLLDLPLAAFGVALLASLWLPERRRYAALFACATVGWWIKDLAVLPALAAALLGSGLREPRAFAKRTFWVPAGLFAVAALGWLALTRAAVPAAVLAVTQNALPISAPRTVYVDAILSDSPALWTLPLLWIWLAARWRFEIGRPAFSFGLAALLHVAAVATARTTLPHYLLPAIVYGLIALADLLGRADRRAVILLGALLLVQAARVRVDLDPAPDTRRLGSAARSALPEGAWLCVVDAYFVGFRYYADRPTLGLYSTPRAHEAVATIPEFSGWVRPVDPAELPASLPRECEDYAVVRSGQLPASAVYRTLESGDRLALVKFDRGGR